MFKKKFAKLWIAVDDLNEKLDNIAARQQKDEEALEELKDECKKMYFNLEKLIEQKDHE